MQNETRFYILRFLLGVAEAGFFPGVIYYFTRWLPAADRGKAIALFLSGSAIASIISGPLAGMLMQIQGLGMHGWQWMLFVEGLFSIFLCVFVWFWLDPLPKDAKWLNDAEKKALTDKIDQEQREREDENGKHVSMLKLLKDPQIILFCCIYFAIQLTIYAATFWLPSIIRQMGGLGEIQIGLLNSVPWLISILAMYAFAVCSTRWKNPRVWLFAALLIAAVGMFMSTVGGPVAGYIAICVAAMGFKSAASCFWPLPQAYLDARIAVAVLALINSLGNLGGFVAPTTFGILEANTGSIQGGLYGLAATSVVAALLVFRTRSKPAAATEEPRAVKASS